MPFVLLSMWICIFPVQFSFSYWKLSRTCNSKRVYELGADLFSSPLDDFFLSFIFQLKRICTRDSFMYFYVRFLCLCVCVCVCVCECLFLLEVWWCFSLFPLPKLSIQSNSDYDFGWDIIIPIEWQCKTKLLNLLFFLLIFFLCLCRSLSSCTFLSHRNEFCINTSSVFSKFAISCNRNKNKTQTHS